MVFKLELAGHETAETLDTIYYGAKSEGYTSTPGIHKTSDLNSMLQSLIP